MGKVIRDVGGCTDFEAIITYLNTKTQIPSKYKYIYTIKGKVIVDEFENVNPDDYNQLIITTENQTNSTNNKVTNNTKIYDISSIDKLLMCK